MKRNTLLKMLNPILAILIINQIASGMFHDYLDHETFEILHEGGGILFSLGILLHVILNWGWIKVNFFKKARN